MESNRQSRFFRRTLLSAAVAAACGTAMAQSENNSATKPETMDEVIVTGSRIAPPNATSTSPVQVVTRQEIQVSGKTDITDIISQLHGNYRTWNYCVQYRETAFHFVSRLMEEEGIYYYFTHENGKHSLVLCDSPASHQEFPGYGELLYLPAS